MSKKRPNNISKIKERSYLRKKFRDSFALDYYRDLKTEMRESFGYMIKIPFKRHRYI